MAIRIRQCAEVIGPNIIITWPAPNEIAMLLTGVEPASSPNPGPSWKAPLSVGQGKDRKWVMVELVPFLSQEDYNHSFNVPIFVDVPLQADRTPLQNAFLIFRNRMFLPDRRPLNASEKTEIQLRVKKIVYQQEEEIKSLQSYVANIEAAIEYQRNGPKRDPIPDDVKVLVWARDGGACVRCGSKESLHFDHIIPVSKGGGKIEANIQLLCETCNLKKSDKISF